jgi:cytochrome c oxidase subunit III
VSIERSRTAIPVVDRPAGLTMGSWAMWLALTAFTTAIAGLAAAGLYLHSGQPAWPPAPLTRPSPLYAVVLLVLAAFGALAAQRAKVALRRDQPRSATSAMGVALLALLASVATAAVDLANAGFRWDAHAYTSLYWVLTVMAAIFVGVGVLLLASVLIQRLIGVVDAHRMLELEVTVGYLVWSVGAAAVLLAVVHLLPDPASGAAAALAVIA